MFCHCCLVLICLLSVPEPENDSECDLLEVDEECLEEGMEQLELWIASSDAAVTLVELSCHLS